MSVYLETVMEIRDVEDDSLLAVDTWVGDDGPQVRFVGRKMGRNGKELLDIRVDSGDVRALARFVLRAAKVAELGAEKVARRREQDSAERAALREAE